MAENYNLDEGFDDVTLDEGFEEIVDEAPIEELGALPEVAPEAPELPVSGGQEATAGLTGAGIYTAQKGVEGIEDKLGVFRKLKEATSPELLAYKGVGGDTSAKEKAMPIARKKEIGGTLLKEDIPGVFTNPQERYENIQDKLKEAGKEIGEESKKAKAIITKKAPNIQKEFSKAFGQQISNEFKILASDLSDIPSDVKLKKQLLKDAKRYSNGVDLVGIEKDIKAYAKLAGYLEFGGIPKHPLAAQQRNILQKVRVETIKDLIGEAGGDISRLEDLNKRYFDLSNAEKVVKKFRDTTASRTGVDALADVGGKILRGGIGTIAAGGPIGMAAGLATDKQVQRSASRIAAKAQTGKIGDILKKVGGGLKFGGTVLWKSLPVIGALTAYSTARAEGLSEKDAIASAGLEEMIESVPILGQVKMMLEPTKTGPKFGSYAEKLESGKVSGKEAREKQKAHFSMPDSSEDNLKKMIDDMQNHPDIDKYERFLTPLVKSLGKPKQTRDAIIFGLMQHPTFRELIKGKKKEE